MSDNIEADIQENSHDSYLSERRRHFEDLSDYFVAQHNYVSGAQWHTVWLVRRRHGGSVESRHETMALAMVRLSELLGGM